MGADRRANGGDCGHSEGDRISLAPRRDVSALQVHATEGLPSLWPSRLRKDLDRTSGSRQSLKAGGCVKSARACWEGGQVSGDSRGLPPRLGARVSGYVIGGFVAD